MFLETSICPRGVSLVPGSFQVPGPMSFQGESMQGCRLSKGRVCKGRLPRGRVSSG